MDVVAMVMSYVDDVVDIGKEVVSLFTLPTATRVRVLQVQSSFPRIRAPKIPGARRRLRANGMTK